MAQTKRTSRKTYRGGSDNGVSDPSAPGASPSRGYEPSSAAATTVPPKPAKRTSIPRQVKKAAKSRKSRTSGKTSHPRRTTAKEKKAARKSVTPTGPLSQKARKNKALDRIMQSVGGHANSHARTSPAYEAAPIPATLPNPHIGIFTKEELIMLNHLQKKVDAHYKETRRPDTTPQTTGLKTTGLDTQGKRRPGRPRKVAPPPLCPPVNRKDNSIIVPSPKKRKASHELVSPAAVRPRVDNNYEEFSTKSTDDESNQSERKPAARCPSGVTNNVTSRNIHSPPLTIRASGVEESEHAPVPQLPPARLPFAEWRRARARENALVEVEEQVAQENAQVEVEEQVQIPPQNSVQELAHAPVEEQVQIPPQNLVQELAHAPVPENPAHRAHAQENALPENPRQVPHMFDLLPIEESTTGNSLIVQLIEGDLDSYVQVHKEFVRTASARKYYRKPFRDNPNQYRAVTKKGGDDSFRRVYACLLALHYVLKDSPNVTGRRKMNDFLDTEEQLVKAGRILTVFKDQDEEALDAPVQYYLDTYDIGHALGRIKVAYDAVGHRYWKSMDVFERTPQHLHVDYKPFIELLSKGKHRILSEEQP